MTTPAFQEGTYALAYHGAMIYEAKILKTKRSPEGWEYYIHYHKWDAKWDEWVPAQRLLALTPQNKVIAQQNNESVKAASTADKSKGKAGAKPKGKGDTDAAASGPARKRKLDSSRETDDHDGSGSAFKLELPASLKKHVVDDWEFITQKHFLYRLPKPSASADKTAPSSANPNSVSRILDDYLAWVAFGGAAEASAAKKGKAGAGASSSSSSAAAGKGSSSAPPASASSSSASSSAAAAVPSPATVKAVSAFVDSLRAYFDRALPVFLLYRFERPQLEATVAERHTVGDDRPWAQLYGGYHLLRLLVKMPDLLGGAPLSRDEADCLHSHLGDLARWLHKHGAAYFSADAYAKATATYAQAFEAAAAGTAPANARVIFDELPAAKA